jgi:hypothetical protein
MMKNKINHKSIKKAMDSVHASVEIEGLKPSKFVRMLGKRYFKGEITGEEAIAKIKENYLDNKDK